MMDDPVLVLFIMTCFFLAGILSMALGAFFKWLLSYFVEDRDERW